MLKLLTILLAPVIWGCGTEATNTDSDTPDSSTSFADASVNQTAVDATMHPDLSLTGTDADTVNRDAYVSQVDATTPEDAQAQIPPDASRPSADAQRLPVDSAMLSVDALIESMDAQVLPEPDTDVPEPVVPTPCEDLLTPSSDPDPAYIFTACPAEISVGACRSAMQEILRRNPAVQLCPYQTGAAAGDGWCPVRGFAQTCWGYVGTGGDENTRCDTGALEFARAYMRNAQTDEERRACAVVTAVMSHEGGFAPTAKSWDMFCNGGNTGAVGLFQYDFASGIDPLPAGIDAQFEQFFRGVSGPRFAGLADAWMACNPRIAGATAATMIDYNNVALPACAQAGAPVDQRLPEELNCRFQGDTTHIGGEVQTRCGTNWADANTRCGTPCTTNDDCDNNETCFADLDESLCTEAPPLGTYTRCGNGWADANSRCGTSCRGNEDCEDNEDCFADLDVSVCTDEPTSSTRCGADWVDANGRCGAACSTNEDCSPEENCFADLDTSICAG